MPLFPPARFRAACVTVSLAALAAPALSADPPAPDLALSFRPSQKGVEIDVPEKADVAKCQVKVEKKGKVSGWVVLGPQGQLLRRFLDTNGDNVVDQWRYYRNGLEVYRDLDVNGNNKIDQSRWVNTGGSRWAIDANEDGAVDSWKVLSAEEASRVAVEAMLGGDAALLQTVLLTPAEVESLGINPELTKQLVASVANPERQMAEASRGSKVLTPNTSWMRFDSSSPGLIPADEGKAEKDLHVYENAIAIVDVAGQPGLIQIGEMVKIGDTWKLTQVPKPIEGENVQIAGGVLMQPPMFAPEGVPGGISPQMREWLDKLQALDKQSPQPTDGTEAFAKYNADRATILRGLMNASDTPEDKELWTRQFADSVSAAVQMGSYPEGLKSLVALEKDLADRKADESLRSYVTFRRLFADYNLRLRQADEEGRVEVQKWWVGQLEAFVKAFPDSPDAADALLQLALGEELAREPEQAVAWYEKLAKSHPETGPGAQAAGALRRLGLKGKPFEFSGKGLKGGTISAEDFRGKLTLVIFWSTTCIPCEQELPSVRALYQKHRRDGFEILGINLDPTAEPVPAYLSKFQMTWPQVHEPGGQESKPAREFGIVSLPTMFLVGRDGTVLSRAVSLEALEEDLPKLLSQGG